MLDGLLGRGFSTKCKSSIKLLRRRFEMIKRKRNSMTRFLKEDIAELLKSGLDVNAYGRAEGLIVELNLSSCYDLVEQFCGCILEQLSCMQNQRDCPEESREAVSCLMFAAARFADLPELCDLRSTFTERYGNTLASFVNQEFVEKLASKSPSMDEKLKLMQEISQEFSLNWDSKTLIERISNPSVVAEDQPKKCEPLHHGKDDTFTKMNKQDIPSHREQELTPGTGLIPRIEVNTDIKYIHPIGIKNDQRRFGINISNHKESSKFGKPHNSNKISNDKGSSEYVKPHYENISSQKESSEYVEPHYNNMPPPYVKPRGSKYGKDLAVSDADHIHKEPPNQFTSDRSHLGSSHTGHGTQVIDTARLNGHGDDSRPKPRSVRRRPIKPPVSDNSAAPVGNEHMSRSSNDRKTHGVEQGIPTSIADHDDEEKVMDKLLMHYSNKPSDHESSKLTSGLNAPLHHISDSGESPLSRKNDTTQSNLGSTLPPTRAVSLPREPMATTAVAKVPIRAATFQPDMSSVGHVHPKLPDYDDLAAQFAALKGGCKG